MRSARPPRARTRSARSRSRSISTARSCRARARRPTSSRRVRAPTSVPSTGWCTLGSGPKKSVQRKKSVHRRAGDDDGSDRGPAGRWHRTRGHGRSRPAAALGGEGHRPRLRVRAAIDRGHRDGRGRHDVARKRRKHLTSVDKANVLVVSTLWREVVTRVAKDYPDVTLDHVLVDNCAMALVHKPTQFDTIVTENTFGDILSDEAAILAGSMGMLPSASLGPAGAGRGAVGLYEPVHGTAPDIAGKGVANPIAAILSAAMLLRYSLDRGTDADRIEQAVLRVLEQGHRTGDIAARGEKVIGTKEMGDLIVRAVESQY